MGHIPVCSVRKPVFNRSPDRKLGKNRIAIERKKSGMQSLRILEPTGFFDKKLQAISFEINDVSIYSK